LIALALRYKAAAWLRLSLLGLVLTVNILTRASLKSSQIKRPYLSTFAYHYIISVLSNKVI